ncbi:site-specific integrase [Croceivirga radicis]|uniref:site-specific integrase n=1 Tax=Croceivirga radicis TaxID=1929488 RepID=UPI000255AECC|nr:site-specific integrase [Croceivirga radicis]
MNLKKKSIRFILSKSRTNKIGLAPIYCRITYLKERKQFATGLFAAPEEWCSTNQKAYDDILNKKLSLIANELEQVYLKLAIKGDDFTVDDIFQVYVGNEALNNKEFYLLKEFKAYLSELDSLVNITIKRNTVDKFYYVYNLAKEFTYHKYGSNDIKLDSLNMPFIKGFENYLLVEKKQAQVSVNKAIQRLRKPVRIAIEEGKLSTDPFASYKAKKIKTIVVFLDEYELRKLEEYEFNQKRLNFVKDLFVFSCYTGLAYRELMNLKKEHIKKSFDDNIWIKILREKTGEELSIPLLNKAQNLIDKYISNKEYVFPRISNQKINSYLKEIAVILDIKKKLTHHVARKTFASTVLLYNDVPMEVVSKLLGHSSLSITEKYYAKVIDVKLSKNISDLNLRLQ